MILGAIMSVLDTTIVNVALATSVGPARSLADIQWVVTGYLLALAAVIPVTGWAARRFGARRVYVVALVLFTAGSVLCGLAWSTGSLVVFRVAAGRRRRHARADRPDDPREGRRPPRPGRGS